MTDHLGPAPQAGEALFPAPAPTPPATGDPAVDGAVAQLAAAMDGSLDDQVEAADRMQHALAERLGDLDAG